MICKSKTLVVAGIRRCNNLPLQCWHIREHELPVTDMEGKLSEVMKKLIFLSEFELFFSLIDDPFIHYPGFCHLHSIKDLLQIFLWDNIPLNKHLFKGFIFRKRRFNQLSDVIITDVWIQYRRESMAIFNKFIASFLIHYHS